MDLTLCVSLERPFASPDAAALRFLFSQMGELADEEVRGERLNWWVVKLLEEIIVDNSEGNRKLDGSHVAQTAHRLVLDVPLYCRIATMELWRPAGRTTDRLFISTERYEFCIPAYVRRGLPPAAAT